MTFYEQLIFGMTGALIELNREVLEVSRANYAVNTQTLRAVVERNELEKEVISRLDRLIELFERGYLE